MNLRQSKYRFDFQPIDSECECLTCKRHTRAYLNSIVTVHPTACHLLTIHNLHFQVSKPVWFIISFLILSINLSSILIYVILQMSLMRSIRQSIKEQKFPEFVQNYMKKAHPDGKIPQWIIESLQAVNIELDFVPKPWQ